MIAKGSIVGRSESESDSGSDSGSGSGRYSVIEDIGGGSFGRVYSAYDETKKRLVAVKVVDVKKTGRPSLESEINLSRIANELCPEGTVVLLDEFPLDEHRHCLVLELMKFSLDRLVMSLPCNFLSLEKVKEIGWEMFQILESLSRDKVKSFVHADIKPANIFIEPEKWSVKLGDFGVSAVGSGQTERVGTLQYMAPEVLLNLSSYDSSVDMWAVACTLFELFSGRRLFNRCFLPDLILLMVSTCGTPPPEFIKRSRDIRRHFVRRQGHWHLVDETVRPFDRNLRKSLEVCIGAQEEIYEAVQDGQIASFAALLEEILKWQPSRRLTPSEALKHPFFSDFD